MLSDTDVQQHKLRNALRGLQADIWDKASKDVLACPYDQIRPITDKAQSVVDQLETLIREMDREMDQENQIVLVPIEVRITDARREQYEQIDAEPWDGLS